MNATTQRPPATKPNLKSPKVAVKSQFGVTAGVLVTSECLGLQHLKFVASAVIDAKQRKAAECVSDKSKTYIAIAIRLRYDYDTTTTKN